MVDSGKKEAYLAIGIILLIVKVYEIATEPNFGFADFWYGEGLGFNSAHIGLILLGIWLVYKGLKKK